MASPARATPATATTSELSAADAACPVGGDIAPVRQAALLGENVDAVGMLAAGASKAAEVPADFLLPADSVVPPTPPGCSCAALHRIAITQLRLSGPGQNYHRRRRAQGDATGEAVRALKRRIARVVYQHLKQA